MLSKKGMDAIRIIRVFIITLLILFALLALWVGTGDAGLTEIEFDGKMRIACNRFENRGCCRSYDEEDPGQCAVDKVWEGYDEEEMDEELIERLEEVDWEQRCC